MWDHLLATFVFSILLHALSPSRPFRVPPPSHGPTACPVLWCAGEGEDVLLAGLACHLQWVGYLGELWATQGDRPGPQGPMVATVSGGQWKGDAESEV